MFGAVHYLLLKGKTHKIEEFYPSITQPTPREINRSMIYFKDFCQQYTDDIKTILETKLVQTNEARRCSYLYPAFCYIYNLAISFNQNWNSAGLQLLWDEYSYSILMEQNTLKRLEKRMDMDDGLLGKFEFRFQNESNMI